MTPGWPARIRRGERWTDGTGRAGVRPAWGWATGPGSASARPDPMLRDERRRLGPPLEVQLREDRGDVVLDRLVGEIDLGRDLLVGLSLGHEEEDLLLLGGELGQL